MINLIAGFQIWRIRDVVVHPEDDYLMANGNNRHANVVKSQLKEVLNHDDRGDKGSKTDVIITYKLNVQTHASHCFSDLKSTTNCLF